MCHQGIMDRFELQTRDPYIVYTEEMVLEEILPKVSNPLLEYLVQIFTTEGRIQQSFITIQSIV